VSCTVGLMAAPDQNRAIAPIESFLRLIGRGIGTILRVAMSMSASSSESSRHPRETSAAQSVLLPDPGGAGNSIARPARSITAAWTTMY
jgi:hypothetical protein